ncbi:hypothetical protein VE00_10218 [Pseudogymnoascus sp. WSF 3629]|nr:hypothetical protein VE00_10218 [Pseudogymnoascus sp. WSF 3629]
MEPTTQQTTSAPQAPAPGVKRELREQRKEEIAENIQETLSNLYDTRRILGKEEGEEEEEEAA